MANLNDYVENLEKAINDFNERLHFEIDCLAQEFSKEYPDDVIEAWLYFNGAEYFIEFTRKVEKEYFTTNYILDDDFRLLSMNEALDRVLTDNITEEYNVSYANGERLKDDEG